LFGVTQPGSVVQGNHKLTWEVDERRGHFGYIIIARGHDPNYLDSYSVKKGGQEEIDWDRK
jgi:hypothetical protein